MGQSPSSANYTNNKTDFILVQGNADIKNRKVLPRVWTTEVTKVAKKGDILLSVRAPVGEVAMTDYNVVIGRGMASLRGNKFLFQRLIALNEFGFWNKLSSGSTFESINSSDIKNINLFIPNEDEQIAIGELLSYVDKINTLYQR